MAGDSDRFSGIRGLADAATPFVAEVRLAYAIGPAGRIVHVSEVVTGLECDCRCPACGAALVARRGDVRRHHFAHAAETSCAAGIETALHLLAKEILEQTRRILLPAATAEYPAQDFAFDDVRIERRLGAIAPDAILRRGGRELAVEIAVTHPCDEGKIARLRTLGLAAIEIDLSAVPRDADRAGVAAAVLDSAPRRWLYNRRIDEAADRLAQESRDAAAPLLAAVARAWAARPVADGPAAVRVRAAGFGAAIGHAIAGDRCFRDGAAEWQAALFGVFALDRLENEAFPRRFSAVELLGEARRREWLSSGYPLTVDAATAATIAAQWPEFQRPYRVVEAYCERLAGLGLLDRQGRDWSLSAKLVEIWREGQGKNRLAMTNKT